MSLKELLVPVFCGGQLPCADLQVSLNPKLKWPFKQLFYSYTKEKLPWCIIKNKQTNN